jgi:hypothetical protein
MIDYSFVKQVLQEQADALKRIAKALELHPEIKFQRDLEVADQSAPRTRSLVERCSFCARGKDQVEKLIAGPGVYICDACTALCADILADPLWTKPKEADVVTHDFAKPT